jgi:hypothetical protein
VIVCFVDIGWLSLIKLSKIHNSDLHTTYHTGNPGLGLGQTEKCGGVKPVNGIPTALLITGSPMVIHI